VLWCSCSPQSSCPLSSPLPLPFVSVFVSPQLVFEFDPRLLFAPSLVPPNPLFSFPPTILVQPFPVSSLIIFFQCSALSEWNGNGKTDVACRVGGLQLFSLLSIDRAVLSALLLCNGGSSMALLAALFFKTHSQASSPHRLLINSSPWPFPPQSLSVASRQTRFCVKNKKLTTTL
jgi:hypothetical protein